MNQTERLAEMYEDAYWTERFAVQAERDQEAALLAHLSPLERECFDAVERGLYEER